MTLLQLFGISVDVLDAVLAIEIDPEAEQVGPRLLGAVIEGGARVPDEYMCAFHHATRSLYPDRYTRDGIGPFDEAIEVVWNDLADLLMPDVCTQDELDGFRRDLETDRVPCSWIYRAKINQGGGPFGWLIRELALAPPAMYHDYTRVPEIVEDIAGCAPPEWELLSRFCARAAPCIVSFQQSASGNQPLEVALEYLWRSQRQLSVDDLACLSNAQGRVYPERVLGVERLPSR